MEFYKEFEIEFIHQIKEESEVYEIASFDCTIESADIIFNSSNNGVGVLQCNFIFDIEYILSGYNEIRFTQVLKKHNQKIELQNDNVVIKEVIISSLNGKLFGENKINITGDMIAVVQEV
ncbi:MAG: hypothetical protein ACRC2K_12655 [Clostridium sp.]